MRSTAAEREACRYISHLVQARCGIDMSQDKEALIRTRLNKRMRHYGLSSLPAYCDFLRSRKNDEELARVVDAVTTHFTNFFREADHFKFMVSRALPSWAAGGEAKFRAWSAAASSGEEAYSIGMYLAEHAGSVPRLDWHITASDVSGTLLEQGRLGIYAAARARSVPLVWLRKYFQKGSGQWEGHFRIKQALAERVTFRRINLIEDYSHAHCFHVIFLRNILIYLDQATQEQLVKRVCRYLAPGGYLFIGHSENLNGLKVPVRTVEPSIYQNNPPAPCHPQS